MPVKEQYKKAKKQVEELLHPELADKRQKKEQSIANMMLSQKGTLLDVIKQVAQLSLNVKSCKNIQSSPSTLEEKLVLDKKAMESEESKAIFSMLLFIKEANGDFKKPSEGAEEHLDTEDEELKKNMTLPAPTVNSSPTRNLAVKARS